MSASRCAAIEKPSRTYIPDEYHFTGVSMNGPTPAKATMRSSLRAISRRRMPSTEPLRKMFSRPVSSGWKPEPTSMSAASRPRSVMVPPVGAVMRESSLRIVLLPAPLWPMMPSVSPRAASKLTSRTAQKSRLRNPAAPVVCRRRYRFETPSNRTSIAAGIMAGSQEVGHRRFGALESEVRERKRDGGDDDGKPERDGIGIRVVQEDVAERRHDPRHRIQQVPRPPRRRNGAERIDDRRGEHQRLDQDRQRDTDVADADLHGGEDQRHGQDPSRQQSQDRHQVQRV